MEFTWNRRREGGLQVRALGASSRRGWTYACFLFPSPPSARAPSRSPSLSLSKLSKISKMFTFSGFCLLFFKRTEPGPAGQPGLGCPHCAGPQGPGVGPYRFQPRASPCADLPSVPAASPHSTVKKPPVQTRRLVLTYWPGAEATC